MTIGQNKETSRRGGPDSAGGDYSGELASGAARSAPGSGKDDGAEHGSGTDHSDIGIPDAVWEHEDERRNPGQTGDGSRAGAGGDRPKATSNSA